MEWYVYVARFFAGAFLANAVPHFVAGVQGRRFPSPFASPPGRGESSPVVNVVWGAANAAAGSEAQRWLAGSNPKFGSGLADPVSERDLATFAIDSLKLQR